MNDDTRANISEHCKWVEKMLDKEHEAEIKKLNNFKESVILSVSIDDMVKIMDRYNELNKP